MADKTEAAGTAPPSKAPSKAGPKKKRVAAKTALKNNTVKLSSIILPADWNREKLGDISELIAALSSVGQLAPILVRPGPTKGTYILVDGRRRYAALLKMGAVFIMITVSTAKNDREARLQALIANLSRKNNTPYEIAKSFGKMAEVDKLSNEEIAQACGRSAGYVSQHLSVFKADPKLQAALRKQTISLAMFRQFPKLDRKVDSDFYEKMMDKAFAGMSAQTIGDNIDTYLTRKAEKAAREAAKAGVKVAKPAAKRGAAAHKSTPKLIIPDYRSAEVYKRMKPIKKKDVVDWLDTYRDKALAATTKSERSYSLGVLDGLELSTGLLVEDR